MGYFKRPIRRGAARRARLEHFEPARTINPAHWQPWGLDLRQGRDSYLRFVVQRRRGKFVGLFRSSDLLEDADDLPDSVRSQVRLAYRWFDENVSVPRRLPRNAVCWFRSDAAESVRRLRVLLEAYRMAGHAVLMQASQSPGRVVYQDDIQVAAIPFADRRQTPTAV